MNKWAYIVGVPVGLYITAYVWRAIMWKWQFFQPTEFGPWLPFINEEWLNKADSLRYKWQSPIYVSPVKGALGRAIYADEEGFTSQHNLLLHGVINAVDVFPAGRNGGPMTPDEIEEFKRLAIEMGFTGIGVYPDTQYRGRRWPMFHLDVRPPDGTVALWGRYGGGATNRPNRYVAFGHALTTYRREYYG